MHSVSNNAIGLEGAKQLAKGAKKCPSLQWILYDA